MSAKFFAASLAAVLFIASVPALSQAQVLGQRMPYMNGPNPPQVPHQQHQPQSYNQQQWLAYLAQQQALQTQMLQPAISAPAAPQPTVKHDYVVTVAFVMMHTDGRMATVRREFHTHRWNPTTRAWEHFPNVHQNVENVKSNLNTNGWSIRDSYQESATTRTGNW